jgi:3-hydroxyisobutyrate dehydrogenase-like beta-hydroxyacid dehydrogenase
MQSLGARVADTVSEAAVGVEALITMLADDRAVQDVIFESGRVSNLGVLSIRYRRERSISQ